MTTAALATLNDLIQLGPVVADALTELVLREQGQPLPLFACDSRGGPWDLLAGQPMTSDLADALQQVEDLSDHSGHGLLRMRLEAAGVPLPSGLSRQALAVWAAVHHPRVFRKAHALRHASRAVRLRTLSGRGLGAPLSPTPLDRHDLERRLGAAFDALGRTAMCRVLAYQDAGGLHFVVDHGDSLRHVQTVELREDGFEERCLGLRPRRRDYVHYAPRTGALSVGAWDAQTLAAYGRVFGQHLFLDPDWFERAPAVCLEPLRDLGPRSLCPTADVLEARLVALSWVAPGPEGSRMTVESPDVFTALERDGGEAMLDLGHLRSARIRVRVAGVPRARTVELKPPMTVGYDWRKGGDAVRRFLERRGFLAPGVA